MTDNIIFSLARVPDGITDKVVYHANVQTNGTVGPDELAERLGARTKQDVSLWKYYLNAVSDELEASLLAGYRVSLGQLSAGFAIRGAFMSEDDHFDHARHQLVPTVRALNPLKSAIAAISPANITVGLTCTVASAMDAVTKRLSEITGTNRLLIQGMKLGISSDNPDEGVWLADPKTGDVVATATVERSDSQTIDCVFEDLPEPGTYTLVVSCRNGMRESLKPAVARIKNFTVKSA